MSIVDFVVADRSDALNVLRGDRSKWPSFRTQDLTFADVALVHFAIAGSDPGAPTDPPRERRNPFTGETQKVTVGQGKAAEFLDCGDGSDLWLHEVPASMVQALASIDDGAVDAVATRWSTFESMESADGMDLKRALFELVRLARLANSGAKSLFIASSD